MPVILFAFLVSFFLTTSLEAAQVKQTQKAVVSEKKLDIDKVVKKQGEFFKIYAPGFTKKPRLWFNSREYPMYDSERGPRALIPVENFTKPGQYTILAKLDDWEEKIPVTIKDNGKPVSHITLSDDKVLYATKKELNIVGSSLGTRTEKQLWKSKFSYPSKAERSSPFGVKRSYNNGPVDSYHKGLDFAGEMGSPVYAPADGVVIAVGKEKEGFIVHGNTIILNHGQALTSIYMHLSEINVKEGEMVEQGQLIGKVGHTGVSTGPHLHWGTYLYGISVDPELLVQESL